LAQATTSNGWAAHPSEAQAKLNAIFELVERDAVLAQWYSKTPFLRLTSAEFPENLQRWASTELAISEYPELIVLFSTEGLGHWVFDSSPRARSWLFAESAGSFFAQDCAGPFCSALRTGVRTQS
jgi:ribosomal protein S12 methylthiotransferase accessory factor YcaO